MNGRTVFAVNRSPVLAWNVEPTPLPYADMPAAAAAAISPAADPYARCWQNQVEAGSGFSYLGALYNNSLPPTAYRLQPGCMANLSQFWPPTPPPDGCGRYDGSNLYLGPHVYRHSDSIPSNLRNSYQGLGHYSHVVETSKESSQRTFKQETPVSPNVKVSGMSMGSSVSKSESYNSLCAIDSKLKPQVSISSTLPKQEIMPASSSNHEPYFCAPDSRGSSSLHPSNDKACFSPPYSLKNTLSYQNHPQDISAHKLKVLNAAQENNCNASPLKNVYFSNIESENVNSVLSKKFKSNEDHYQRFDPKTVSIDISKSRNSTNFLLHNPYASKKYDVSVSPECCNVNSNCKLRTDKQSSDCIMVVGEHKYKQKNNVNRVKPEKSAHSDCKYQRTVKNTTNMMHIPEYRTSSETFNIPTSVMHSKLESNDKYFLSNCSSTVPSCISNSYANSGTYLLSKDFSQAYHHGMVYPNSCSLSKPWHVPELPVINSDTYFKAPEASKPPIAPRPSFASPASMHEEPVSVAQTAPQDINSVHVNNRKLPHPKMLKERVDDDDVQIISVKSPLPITPKSNSRVSVETKPSVPISSPEIMPLSLKTEVEPEKPEADKALLDTKTESNAQWIKTEPVPPVLEKEAPISNINSSIESKSENFDFISAEPPKINREVVAIKQEVIHKETSDKCDIMDTENKTSDLDQNLVSPEIVTDDSSNTSKMPELEKEHLENVPMSDFNDTNHNFNLLLNTIEKVTSLENSSRSHTPVSVKIETIENEAKVSDEKLESSKPCGLDLLSVIAGQRLESEFETVDKTEDIKSNYPLIINEDKEISEDTKPKLHSLSSLQKASVSEMQAKLAELQKKYKQKQKEVSRLKPKKRFTNMFLNGQKKSSDEQDASSGSNMDLTDLNGSTSADDLPVLEDEEKEVVKKENAVKDESVQDIKEISKKTRKRRASSEACSSEPTGKQIRTRSSSRHSVKQGASDGYCSSPSELTHKSTKLNGYQLRKMKASSLCNSVDDDIQIIGVAENSMDKLRHTPRRKYLCDNKRMETYSLRHSSQINKKEESNAFSKSVSLRNVTSKRKSDNPKKYMPSKQGKLSETIIAKQLRNRILFDTSGSMSDDDNTKDGGVVEELYDALMKCNLEDRSKKEEKSHLSSSPLGSPDPRRLKPEDLAVKQRLLALDDGIFYPGTIKEVQANDRYGIMLDERRGNRLQSFTKEELLTLAIVESKPLSSELPEGTRVCAFWNEYYGCLYPGTVKKAPCPSADWSEPRVYVIFDDGDFGHYVLKNIRLIPPDIITFKNDTNTENANPVEELQNSLEEETPPRLQCSTPKTSSVKDCDTGNENESKDSSCASINDSSCDDSCFIEYTLATSHNQLKVENNSASCSFSNDTATDNTKLEKRQKKHSKRKISSRTKLKEDSSRDKSESKAKRHKKYKEKHRKHHRHHRYHHRHHHHHHHHSKKHKHKKKVDKNSSSSQDLDKPTFIPCGHKTFKGLQQKEAVTCTNHVEHSSTANLPQNENTNLLE